MLRCARLQIPTKYRKTMIFEKPLFDNFMFRFKLQTVIWIFLVISRAD